MAIALEDEECTEPSLRFTVLLEAIHPGGPKDSQLFAINLADGSTFSTRPKNVAVERDFNRISGDSPGELDAALSAFESKVDAALDRIHCSRRIDDREE